MSLIGKANESVDLVKNALDAKIALATAEQKELLADAKLALADLKTTIADLTEENRELESKIKLKDEVIYDDDGIAWIKGNPYCGGCLGSKSNQVKLKYHRGNHYSCPACRMSYGSLSSPRKAAPEVA